MSLLSDESTNQCIRNMIQRDIVSEPASVFYWNNFMMTDWENTSILSRKFFIPNKVQLVLNCPTGVIELDPSCKIQHTAAFVAYLV